MDSVISWQYWHNRIIAIKDYHILKTATSKRTEERKTQGKNKVEIKGRGNGEQEW